MNSIVKALQNCMDPLPPKQTAHDLKGVINAVGEIPAKFDVSVEWVQNYDNIRKVEKKGGCYLILPTRANGCSYTTLPSPEVVQATKQVMHQEIRKNLVVELQEAEDVPSALVNSKWKDYSRRMAKAKNPHAPVNREFLENIFSDHGIDKITITSDNKEKEQ